MAISPLQSLITNSETNPFLVKSPISPSCAILMLLDSHLVKYGCIGIVGWVGGISKHQFLNE